MAFVMNASSCGATITLPSAIASGPVTMFMAVLPETNTSTWPARGLALLHATEAQVARCDISGNGALRARLTNAGGGDVNREVDVVNSGSWKRCVARMNASTNIATRVSGGSLGSTATGLGYWPGGNYATIFTLNSNAAGDTFPTLGSKFAHFGYYLGEWSDTEIADFCAGTWNPANAGKVTAYWDGSSLASQVGGLTLVNRGTNNITFDSDTGHGVPAYSNGTFALAQSGAMAMAGALAISGNISAQGQFWRVPTNAQAGTPVHVTVFSGSSPTYAILAQGVATVTGGYARIPAATGAPGDKAFAFVHNYGDNTATTSINGGPCVATRFQG